MEHLKFKIAILGEPEVGKSSLNNFCSQRFKKTLEQLHESIFGVSFAVKILKNIDIEIILIVWSFTGEDRYRSLRPLFIKGVTGILLLFDLTRRKTFEKLPRWLSFLKENLRDVPILLLGNKADLFQQKQVKDKEIESFIDKNDLQGYYDISLKTGFNVEQAIIQLAELIYQFMKTGVKVPTKIKIQRKENKPVEINKKKLFDQSTITLKEISNQIYNEISDKIVKLPKTADTNTINKILSEISSYDIKIKKLVDTIPVPLSDSLKRKLLKDWELKKENLLLKIREIKIL